MATIYRRNEGGSWYIDWREDGRRRQVSLKTKDKKIAERELKRLEARLALGVTDLPIASIEEIRLTEFVENYQRHLGPRTSQSYQDGVRRAFERLTNFVGDPKLSRIHTRDVESHITRIADILAVSSVNLDIKILRAGFNQAVRWGHLSSEPTKGIKVLRDSATDSERGVESMLVAADAPGRTHRPAD